VIKDVRFWNRAAKLLRACSLVLQLVCWSECAEVGQGVREYIDDGPSISAR
jgi:hypothetical protein